MHVEHIRHYLKSFLKRLSNDLAIHELDESEDDFIAYINCYSLSHDGRVDSDFVYVNEDYDEAFYDDLVTGKVGKKKMMYVPESFEGEMVKKANQKITKISEVRARRFLAAYIEANLFQDKDELISVDKFNPKEFQYLFHHPTGM